MVLENFSPRVMPNLGFDFDAQAAIKPGIVYTQMPGYGSSGPGQNRVAFGPVIEAAVGLTHMMGYNGEDDIPMRTGIAWPDPVAGMCGTAGTLVGLWQRAVSGEAQHVETAMIESFSLFVGEELVAAQLRGENRERFGNRQPHSHIQGVYPCAGTDRWVAIAAETDDDWAALCDVAGIGDEIRGLDLQARLARHDDVDEAISRWTSVRGARECMLKLQAAGVIAGQLNDGRDLVEDPHLIARDFWAELEHPDVGLTRSPGNPIRFSDTPVTFRKAAPELGEDNEAVLAEVGFSAAEIAELTAAGVVAHEPPERSGGARLAR